jgi:hypothetical protein
VKYLILIYTNPESRRMWQSLGVDQQAEGLAAYAALNEELAKSGELIATEALADAALTTHLRVREGRATTTDGPFAEAKEQLAGFYLVECESPERAHAIATRIPEAEIGVIEVRPILTYAGLEM